MKFSVPASAFKAALDRCSRVIQRRNLIPILTHVAIEASAGGLRIRSSNLQTYISVDVPDAAVSIHGETCAPADELIKLVAAAGKAVLSVEMDGHALRIAWPRASAELNTLPVADFPAVNLDVDHSSPIDSELLIAALRFCSRAVDPRSDREYLQGVCIRSDQGGARIYGTNGHVAHRAVTPGSNFGGSGIIPAADVDLICGLVGPMRFSVSERAWSASVDGVAIHGCVIDAIYPDVDRVLPEFPLSAVIDREALTDAIGVASIGSGVLNKFPVVAINASDGAIRVRGIEPGAGLASGARVEFDAEIRTPGALALNAKYALSTLGAIGTDLVSLMVSHGNGVSIEPAEQRADLTLTSYIMSRRATAEQLAA